MNFDNFDSNFNDLNREDFFYRFFFESLCYNIVKWKLL